MSNRKLSKNESIDIRSMVYFAPSALDRRKIRQSDRVAMANLSGQGKKIEKLTEGIKTIQLGRMYRDEQLTAYIRDIKLGLFTKYELISSMPKTLQPWLEKKLKKVPYDVDGSTTRLHTAVYRQGEYV